ncbi:MAG: hypothetical protein J3Q66DRAFT_375062 [Benniella sp.]|nr:MAG: hypothetical protein J3Q66DRAFT_375062 [Benniella sp.]
MHLVYSLLLLFSAPGPQPTSSDLSYDLLAVATLVQGVEVIAVSSKALFTGIDTTDPTAPIDEIFHTFKNHATATASLLEYYSRQSNFHPKQHGLYTSEDDFGLFLSKFSSLRAFGLKRSEYEIDLEGGLDQLKEAIAATYIPPSGNADEAASAFVNQIPQSADPHLYGTWNPRLDHSPRWRGLQHHFRYRHPTISRLLSMLLDWFGFLRSMPSSLVTSTK